MVFRRLVKDSAIYGGADLITKVLSFFAFPIIAAALSPKAFGILELIFTVTALLGLVINCGLNNAVQRFYWDKGITPAIQPKIVTSGFYAQVALGMMAVIAGFIIIPFVLPLMQASEWPLTWIALVAALLVMALSQWSQYTLDVLRLHFMPWRFFTLAIISRIFTMVLGLVAVVFLGLGIDGLLAAQALVLILVMPLALWMIRKDFRLTSFDTTWFKELVRFGHPFIYAGLAYWLFGSMDRWMLASMVSVEEVGIYSIAFRFASVILFVSAAFGQAWSPVAIKVRTDYPEQYRTIYGQVLLLLLFVMLAVGGGIALFSGEIISQIMSVEYLPSALPLAILCFGVILQSTQQVTAIGISLEKKTYLFARLAWISAIVNFIANWLLIPPLGATGSAWATLIAYIALTGSYLFYTQRLHPLIVQWGGLLLLVIMGTLIAFVAVTMIAENFELFSVALKLALASVFCDRVGANANSLVQENISMKTILITGAGGLLGKSLSLRLIQSKFNVIGLTHSATKSTIPNVKYQTVDFSSNWAADFLPSKVDVIIHLAQSENFRNFPGSALDVFKVNVESTARLLDYARTAGVKQFVYASSGGVYGNGAQAFKENEPIIPVGQLGYYLGSKTCGEILVQSYASVFQVVVLRPFFMYGPGQKRTMLIPRLFDSVVTGKPISLQGENGIRINPIHVEDASAAVTAALSLSESATFNIAGTDILSIREISESMGKYLGRKPVFQQQDSKAKDLIADISAMQDKLYCPRKRLLGSFNDILVE